MATSAVGPWEVTDCVHDLFMAHDNFHHNISYNLLESLGNTSLHNGLMGNMSDLEHI